MTDQTYVSSPNAEDPYAGISDSGPGKVFNITGGDWDRVVADLGDAPEERIVVNMGPQHPSTHGVLRLILELDG
jgi:NADH-quinone oxidoreductase subunit D